MLVQLTDEGMCALTACHIFYYPIDHFKPNGPEDSIKLYQNQMNKKSGKGIKSSIAIKVRAFCFIYMKKKWNILLSLFLFIIKFYFLPLN